MGSRSLLYLVLTQCRYTRLHTLTGFRGKAAHAHINVFSDNSKLVTVPWLWEKFPVSQTPVVMGSS